MIAAHHVVGVAQFRGDFFGLHHAGALVGEFALLVGLGRELGQLVVGVAEPVGFLARALDTLFFARERRAGLARAA